ncbi:DUF305 domain-containing protein [Streptomyces sp. NPDC054842]
MTSTVEPGQRSPALGATQGHAVASAGSFNATDLGWIQLMIAMDGQTQRLLDLVPGQSASTKLKTWAAGASDRNGAELSALRALLAARGAADDNPHKGHDMPGMVDEGQLRALESANGVRFDVLARSALHDHYSQVRKLASSIQEAEASADVQEAARKAGADATNALRDLGHL